MGQAEMASMLEELKKGNVIDRSKLHLLRGINLTSLDLSNANFSQVDLSGTSFFGCNLTGANFFQSNLTEADFTGANVSNANFSESTLDQASFGQATLNETKFFGSSLVDATLTGVHCTKSDFRAVDMRNVRIRDAELIEVDFTGSSLCGADFSDSYVRGSIFNDTDMRDTCIRHLKGYHKAQWIGVDIRNINFSGAYRTRRFIVDQNYLHEFKKQGTHYEWVYFVWWLTSDCGRSLFRWLLVITVQILCFAALYSFLDLEFTSGQNWFSNIYFSIVTSTALGYGDIIPISPLAQVVAMAQVLLGYVMLGGFLSILTNKIARRAD